MTVLFFRLGKWQCIDKICTANFEWYTWCLCVWYGGRHQPCRYYPLSGKILVPNLPLDRFSNWTYLIHSRKATHIISTFQNSTNSGRRPSLFLPEDLPKVISKLRKSGDARRKSLLMSNKERNVIQILTIISIMFAVCNIPQVRSSVDRKHVSY